MQAVIKATSSILKGDVILIESSVTIGESTTSSRELYTKETLMENRFMTGTLEDRIEFLRAGAESLTEKAVQGHFRALSRKVEPEVFEVKGRKADVVIVGAPVKKTRAKRQPKTTNPTESK